MKKVLGHGSLFGAAAAAIVLGASFCSAANADVKYTESIKTDMGAQGAKGAPGVGGGTNHTTTYIADGKQRIETVMQYGPVKMNDVTITVCEDKKVYKLDTDLKIYTATNIADRKPGSAMPPMPGSPPQRNRGKKGTGKITVTQSVKYLGEETVSNRKCRRYMVEMNTKMEGCAGDGDLAMKMEIWVTDFKMPVFDCGERPYEAGMGYGGGGSDCKVTVEQKGDMKAIGDAYRGLIMRTKTYMGEKGKEIVISKDITSLSEAKLPDSTFAIPAGFKLVTEEQFQKERSNAMMKAMMSGSGFSGGEEARNNDDDDDTAKTEDRDKDKRADDAGDDDNNNDDDKPKKKEKKPKFPKFKLPF